jgi:hypothetical protein
MIFDRELYFHGPMGMKIIAILKLNFVQIVLEI